MKVQLLHLKSDSMRSAVSELFRDLDEAGTGHLAYRELHDMLKPLMWAPRLERGTATRRSLARASSAARCSVRPAPSQLDHRAPGALRAQPRRALRDPP